MGSKKLFCYTTSVDSPRTVGQIHGELAGHGARSIMSNYNKDGEIESLSFVIDTPFGPTMIKLPCDPDAVKKVLERENAQPRFLERSHCLRVAWREIYYWVKAQMALLETEMAAMEQIFLPYIITDKSGKTIYDRMLENKLQLPGGKE